MENKRIRVEIVALIVMITALLAGFGAYRFAKSRESSAISGGNSSSLKIVKFNCEQSGGNFNGSACTCKDDSTYEAETGYCVTPFGTPDGELGDTAKKLQELQMLKNQQP